MRARQSKRDIPLEAVPPVPESRVTGYEIRPLALGFEVWLTFGYMSSALLGWTLTEGGAHRRARRAVERERRREERRRAVRSFEV